MNQSLSDLGYKKKERNKLTPVVAHDIIKNQTQFVEDVEIEGDETKKTLSDWDLLYLRLNDAIDRLIDSPNGDEILNLTSLEKNPDKIDAYLKKNQASLSPVEIEFLQVSIAIKTKARNELNDKNEEYVETQNTTKSTTEFKEPEHIPNEIQLLEQRFDYAFKMLMNSYGNSHSRIIRMTGTIDQLDSYLRKNVYSLSPEEIEYLRAVIAFRTALHKRIFKK